MTAHLLWDLSRAAWRSMLWPQADAGSPLHLARALMRALPGRRVELTLGGRRVHGDLHSIWLDRRGDRYAGRLELRSVVCEGLPIERLSIAADDVAFTAQPDVALVACHVELEGHSALGPFVTWLGGCHPRSDLRAVEGGLIQLTPAMGRVRLLVEASVHDGELELVLRAVRCGRTTFRCPRWLRLTRTRPLPTLPDGASVAMAEHRDDRVRFRLSVPTVRHRIDPASVFAGGIHGRVRGDDAVREAQRP